MLLLRLPNPPQQAVPGVALVRAQVPERALGLALEQVLEQEQVPEQVRVLERLGQALERLERVQQPVRVQRLAQVQQRLERRQWAALLQPA